MIAAALAMASPASSDGRNVITAIVLAYEVFGRLSDHVLTTGLGWDQDFEDRDIFAMDLTLLNAGWEDGRWTLLFKRPLKADYEEDTYFEVGKYIPTVFFVWDGHNGDVGRKLAVSSFYYTVLIPPIPMETYIYPTVIAVGIVFLEGWVLTRRANKRKGKA